MHACAVIPARGGSKGLPRKNMRLLCGKPLIAWTIEAALSAETVEQVVVSTDDAEIAAVSRHYGAQVVSRPAEISGDTAPSEAALLHTLAQLGLSQGVMAFLQCTSPLILPEDIDGTVRLLQEADTAFTAVPWHRFLWRNTAQDVEPLGHAKHRRPLRQQMSHLYLEVGAVYAMDIAGFLQAKHRFFGVTRIYPLPPERGVEIDDAVDWLIADTLLRRRLVQQAAARLPHPVEAVVMDFDGVLTDNRMLVTEDGKEAVLCRRDDGWAMQCMREAGIRLAVLTLETNPVVEQRCRKLGIDCITANGPKLPYLENWLRQHGLSPERTIFVGNDTADVPCMRRVGAGVAPADACAAAKQAAQLVLSTPGGGGCVRELVDILPLEQEVVGESPLDHCGDRL